MNKNLFFLGFLAATLAACNGGDSVGQGSQADTVVLDQRCAADADCPSGFECETEVEHGTESSYCVSDEEQGTSTGECPAGYELEVEHEGTFCKAHGGGGDDGAGGSGAGGSGADDGGNGGSGADDGGGNGGAAEGQACVTSADCASGLECEVQVENGVTTSVCKAHGGGA